MTRTNGDEATTPRVENEMRPSTEACRGLTSSPNTRSPDVHTPDTLGTCWGMNGRRYVAQVGCSPVRAWGPSREVVLPFEKPEV